jgi:hypothetical protein
MLRADWWAAITHVVTKFDPFVEIHFTLTISIGLCLLLHVGGSLTVT